jgi:AAA domain
MTIRYVCALRNREAGGGMVAELYYTDPAKADAFAAQWNKPGIGIYDCIGALRDDAKSRCKDTVAELDRVVCDLDLKNICQSRDEVIEVAKTLLLEPSEIRDSGHGLHAVWLLKEPVTDEAGLHEAECVMKQLVPLLAGDPAPTHRAALLRRPGSLNTKGGGARPCRVIAGSGKPYDVSEFADMFDLYGQPLLTLKPNGDARKPASNTFEAVGEKTPVEVQARLTAIAYQGPGDSAIHITWKDCLGSMLRDGIPLQDAVEEILAATEARCQNDPAKEHWVKGLMELATWYLTKFPEFLCTLDPDLAETWHKKQGEGRRVGVIYKRTAQGNHLEVRSWNSGGGPPGNGGTAQAEPEGRNEDTPEGKEKPKPQSAPPQARIYPRPFTCFDFTKIPQREWLYGNHYMRSIASATIGPGGSGKSSLDLVESIAMSTARNLLGEQPAERLRVWYHNGEDPLPELERRVAAICVYYKIDPRELDGYFFCTSGLDMPIKIAGGNGEVKLNHATAGAIITGIHEREIDVLTLDPLITLHSLAEAENHKMDPVLREFARIANDTNCAIELAHHTRKKVSGQDDYTTADARGASAIIDAVRSARTLNGLNNDDAKLLGIDDELERLSYFRVDKGKANMTRRSAARYYKLVGQELPNGLAGGPGDGQLGPGRESAVRKLVRVRRCQASRPRRGHRPRPRQGRERHP